MFLATPYSSVASLFRVQSQIPFRKIWFVFRMSPNSRLMLLLLMALLLATLAAATDNNGNPSGSSVNIISGLNDTFILHCSSKDDDFGEVAVAPKSNYYWKFNPNVFGRTVYNCEFLWTKYRQEFPVWQGSDYSERPTCCRQGPCTYKVNNDGIYNAVTTDTDAGDAMEWTFYQGWMPGNA